MRINCKYNPYESCNCFQCRHSNNMKEHKRMAHRKFRKLSKQMLKNLDDDNFIISTGYAS